MMIPPIIKDKHQLSAASSPFLVFSFHQLLFPVAKGNRRVSVYLSEKWEASYKNCGGEAPPLFSQPCLETLSWPWWILHYTRVRMLYVRILVVGISERRYCREAYPGSMPQATEPYPAQFQQKEECTKWIVENMPQKQSGRQAATRYTTT